MTDMWSIKEMLQCASLGIPKGMKKCNFYFYCFLPWLFDQKWKYNFRGMQNKKPFEITFLKYKFELQAFKAGWLKNYVTVKPLQMNVLFLTTLPTLKACNSPYMQYYFKPFFVLHSSEVIFSFLIKKSRQNAIGIEIAFFIPVRIPRDVHWIICFMLHISVITSPTNWYLYRWVRWNISEAINEKSTSAFNYLNEFTLIVWVDVSATMRLTIWFLFLCAWHNRCI